MLFWPRYKAGQQSADCSCARAITFLAAILALGAGIHVARAQVTQHVLKNLSSGPPADPLPPINFLSISGGGDNGAFAAGVLVGWTASGTRPEFKVVTGVSAGALIAPFAFLGATYDSALKEFYTNSRSRDIFAQV